MKAVHHLAAAAMAVLTLGATAATADEVTAVLSNEAGAPPAQLLSGVYNPGDPLRLEETQFIYGGRNYCWYAGGWHGPGYYWCGYAGRRGFGWGGPAGWHGWRGGGWGGHGWHRGWRHGGHWHGHGWRHRR